MIQFVVSIKSKKVRHQYFVVVVQESSQEACGWMAKIKCLVKILRNAILPRSWVRFWSIGPNLRSRVKSYIQSKRESTLGPIVNDQILEATPLNLWLGERKVQCRVCFHIWEERDGSKPK